MFMAQQDPLTGLGLNSLVRYSGYVYEAPTFSSGFAQGWQIGSAIAAAENQSLGS